MIALCIGRKEQGKTTLGYHLISSMPQRVVYDPRERFRTTDLITNGGNIYDWMVEGESEAIVYAAEYAGERFAFTCGEVKDFAKNNPSRKFGFLVDEVSLAMEDGIPEDFNWIIRATRVEQARIVMTTWRPTETHPSIRSQVDHWFIFKTTEPRDLEVIEEKCGTETMQMVQKLPPHFFVHCDDSKAERVVSVFSHPEAWHVDTSVFNESNRKTLEGVA